MIKVKLEGMDGVERGLRDTQDAIDPALGDAVETLLKTSQRYAESITPVASGLWRSSHKTTRHGLQGALEVEGKAAVYAQVWESRGGSKAVYARTMDGSGALEKAADTFYRSLP